MILAERLYRAAKEPPFRLIAKQLFRTLPTSIRLKAQWDAVCRPAYLTGVLAAADQANREDRPEISVIEFGVAGGQGLLALQKIAAAVEREANIKISVYGFDTGKGLPQLTGDFRDHPDRWAIGDYPMDEQLLREHLTGQTTLILGEVKHMVFDFVQNMQRAPVGFIAVDLDLYSSTRDALRVLTIPGKQMLLHVPMYFDDVKRMFNHRFAGELLAIDEFNAINESVKIDKWRGIADGRAFPESDWLNRMYVAHDIGAISKVVPVRNPLKLDLTAS